MPTVKPFKDVKIGEIGETYFGDPVTIIAKGVGYDAFYKTLEKFDTGAMADFFSDLANGNDEDFDPEDIDTIEMVAVFFEETEDTAVYLYGDEGVVVTK